MKAAVEVIGEATRRRTPSNLPLPLRRLTPPECQRIPTTASELVRCTITVHLFSILHNATSYPRRELIFVN
jgi:hypothetical protein